METVHVIGAGGIGVALGWSLARAGWGVTMVDVNPRKLAAGIRGGLSLDGVRADPVALRDFADWKPVEGAVVLLCTKTYDNAAVLDRIEQREQLVPIQNGFDASLEASEHPCAGIAAFVSQCEPDRPVARLTRRGKLYLGGRRPLTGDQRHFIRGLAAAIRRGGGPAVKVVERIEPFKRAKLMYNAAISPLAAAAGIDNSRLLGDPLARRLFFALLRENYAIFRRRALPLARVGPFSPRVVNWILQAARGGADARAPFPARVEGNLLFDEPGYRHGADRNRGLQRISEMLAHDGDCPVNTAVLELIGAMQARRLSPSPARLVELQDALRTGGAA